MKFMRNKKIIIIFLSLFFSVSAYSQCRIGEEDKGVYDQMKFGMENHLYNDAKIRAKILLTKYGYQCPDLYWDAGWLSFMTESWWDAIEFLGYSLRILSFDHGKFEFAYAAIGVSYYNTGSYENSIAYLNEAINLNQKADYYKYRGMNYYKLEDFTRAMDDFNLAKKYGSDFTDEETDFYWDASKKLKP
jgi:tetratricopeptide (TPR) repeat protein